MTESEFIKYLDELGVKYDDNKLESLNKYYTMLVEYNKVMNLTGITEKKQVYLKHFYDSLTIVKAMDLNKIESLCDIGTGAGFPGMVIKIFYPHLKVTLVDSLSKRINFLKDVIKDLKLENIDAIHARIEDYAQNNKEKFDVVTARAVAPLNILLEYAIPITKVNSHFIPMKGKEEDSNSYSNALKVLNSKVEEIISFKLPIENSDRTIYTIKKIAKTNNKYPRKPNEIKKNML